LIERLTGDNQLENEFSEMPHFGLSLPDASAITAALMTTSKDPTRYEDISASLQAANRKREKKQDSLRTEPDVHQGELTFVSTGCIACHHLDDRYVPVDMAEQLFAGGDLGQIASKRTLEFFPRWLEDPSSANARHRMPRFDLSLVERMDLAAYLASLGASPLEGESSASSAEIQLGRELIGKHRCGACHQLPTELTEPVQKLKLALGANWPMGCLGQPDRERAVPGFALSEENRAALEHYWRSPLAREHKRVTGEQLLTENNCVACHSRDLANGLKSHFEELTATVPDVAPRLAAIAPPSLTGVGDKLQDEALAAAIKTSQPPRRPWLDVRMPKFDLNDQQVASLVEHLIAHDRIPPLETPEIELPDDKVTELAAGRLVTAEGFGCQSCHKIGDSEPPKVALNAHGTDLTMLGEHIRPSWFQRWVRNPARIVPMMEMPAIQTAAKGLLNDSLDLQLTALWKTLNTAGFRPPRPNPVRVVRANNIQERSERAHLLTDVLETSSHNFLRPLIVGLPNRHNFLFDLETGRIATWWIGDMAHQHTRGKSWLWEPGARLLTDATSYLEETRLIDGDGTIWELSPAGQFAAHMDSTQHLENGIRWQGRLHFRRSNSSNSKVEVRDLPSRWITIEQTFESVEKGHAAVSRWSTRLSKLQKLDRIELTTAARWSSTPVLESGQWTAHGAMADAELTFQSPSPVSSQGEQRLQFSQLNDTTEGVEWTCVLQPTLPTDVFPANDVAPPKVKPIVMDMVPGFAGLQLPLPATEMPISIAWDPDGNAYIGSLKGRVLSVHDRDSDGLADTYEVISDEIPTPFGLYVHEEGIDALAKFALLRLTNAKNGGAIRDTTVVVDGWGYTADYHDWAIGLVRDDDHNYYMALPCQQDDRSPEAAYLRGNALKLIPYESAEEPRKYRIEPFAAGLRFPIGIALNQAGDLFTSDNQGNYNPFNELNHLRFGNRYGFINKLENTDGFSPPFESPAINLPHPWTRSVNGICFLRTPEDSGFAAPHFGPFEGHLIGCEMNGRSLVRMSLQKVGETYQGAAYMFSRPVMDGEANLEGPIVCQVAPSGDLWVGNLLDSGWGGGPNTGSIVRFQPQLERLPLGIAEVRATPSGFEIDFTQPVDASKATQADNYQIRSYRRISTPAYGGDDQHERLERATSVVVSADRRRAILTLDPLRADSVYEINIAPIGTDDASLFPSQAHYTMRSIPE
jgi:glucose/arabinose dehydrogenase/mono/diheme cytochrome c family protein